MSIKDDLSNPEKPFFYKFFVSWLVSAFVAFLEIYVARPFIIIFAVLLSIYTFFCISLSVVQRFTRTVLIVYVLFLCGLAVLYSVPWTPRHSFVWDLGRVKPGRYLDRSGPGMIVFARRHGPGMTFAEVERVMQRYRMGFGGKWFWSANDRSRKGTFDSAPCTYTIIERREVKVVDGTVVYGHSEDARFNAVRGHVRFRDGRVVSVSFSPD